MKNNNTILYADDDSEDFSIVVEALETYADHLTVTHAINGLLALEVLDRMKESSKLPCLIILDIHMPVMNGLEALRVIKKVPEYRHIPAVMFSTSTDPADRWVAQSLGADFMTKPSRYVEMEKLVEQFVLRCSIAAG